MEMLYENELNLLCNTLKKIRVRSLVLTPNKFSNSVTDIGLENIFGKKNVNHSPIYSFPRDIEPYTMYKATDAFGLCYIYMLLPESSFPAVLFIGPYLPATPSPEYLLELGEKNKISPNRQRYFNEYFSSIPVLGEGNHIFAMLDTFCEHIWNRPSFSIVDVNKKHSTPSSPINDAMQIEDLDELLVSMKTMEKRYDFENELIHAVSLGQLHKETQLLSAFSEQAFEKRVPDPLRNAKNYGIIMNTLLRKAAESGGVHPFYLDRISSDFAAKIEQLSFLSENTELMREMFRSYCRLVRKHSIKHYSPIVQKTVLLIDSDLSANLSSNSLAEMQNVSLGYLSTIFKKDTGKTISEYIREKRIDYAKHLLGTTHLKIQTVALHCGIVDVQYFSKIFKKQTGITPKEYRETANASRGIM